MTDYWTYEIQLGSPIGSYGFNERYTQLCSVVNQLRIPATGFPSSTLGPDSATVYLLADDQMDILENAMDALRFNIVSKTRGTRKGNNQSWNP